MAEVEEKEESLDNDSQNAPLKRKFDLGDADEMKDERTTKQQKPDASFKDFGDASQVGEKEVANQNGNVIKTKGKSVLSAADKGKGKMTVIEEEDSDEDGKFRVSKDDVDTSSDDESDGAMGSDDDDDSDFSEDPLTELDLDNILSVRTRRHKPLVPGAYLVEQLGNEGDDDDDSDDDDDDSDDDDDGDDDDDNNGGGSGGGDDDDDVKDREINHGGSTRDAAIAATPAVHDEDDNDDKDNKNV